MLKDINHKIELKIVSLYKPFLSNASHTNDISNKF